MTTYYVATTGSDGGNGSASSPWRTIGKAMASTLKPGDEVVVKSGTYNESVTIGKDGSAAGYITLRSEVPGGAKIVAPSGGPVGINVAADYVVVNGFDVKGGGSHGIQANNVHHIKILNNAVHDAAESGIQFNWSDFITIEGNETYNNARSGWFSGISIYQNRNITGDTSTSGFRTIVKNNISHDNVTSSGGHSDGNGIIIDDFQSTQASGYPSYKFATLLENNLVYENGGKGIHVTWSDFVTVRNNTAWHNNQDNQNSGTWRGELSNSQSSNNAWVNNIAVADPGTNSNNTAIDNTSYGGYKNNGTVWYNNITFNGTAGQASVKTDGGNTMPSAANGNKLGVDPKFVNPGAEDFHLQSGSPAINSGSSNFGLGSTDLEGDPRVVGTVDLGVYESGSGGGTGNTPPNSIALGGSKSIAETAADGAVIGQLSASDPDGDSIAFSVSGDSRFAVNGSGQLVVAQGADLAVNANQTVGLTVTANDGKGGVTSAGINVTILDQGGTSGITLHGNSSSNGLYGGTGNDTLYGYGGKDTLGGAAGDDHLRGGTAKDRLTGGADADTFAFANPSEAGRGAGRDVIEDFSEAQSDRIGLSAIDANTGWSGNQGFSFIGNSWFTGKAGELRYAGGIVAGDVNGDAATDFQIEVANAPSLDAQDFLL